MTKNSATNKIFSSKIIVSLIINDKDVSSQLAPRLGDITHTDNRGLEADTLEINLSDFDGALEIPTRGAKIQFSFGWAHEGLVDKGTFTVGKISHSGAPDVLQISAASVDLREKIRELKEKSFHNKTLGDIIKHIAAENGLEPVISAALDAEKIDHIDQSQESDTNLLTRLAEHFDAIATVKSDKLIFIKRGEATTASGKPLPQMIITRASGDGHQFSIDDSENFCGVKACYCDNATAQKGEIIVDKNTHFEMRQTQTKKGKLSKKKKLEITQTIAPSSDKLKVLRHTYATRGTAIRGAKSAWAKIKRGVAKFSINLATGKPELFPEIPIKVIGFKEAIDEIDWIVTKVANKLDSSSGFTQSIELETKLDGEEGEEGEEGDEESEAEE